MCSKPEMNEARATFDDAYNLMVDNKKAESIAVGVSERTTYARCNSQDPANTLKAYEIPYSTKAREILSWLKSQTAQREFFLNGSIDDEFADIAHVITGMREKFLKGDRVSEELITALKFYTNQLIAELRMKNVA